MAKLLVNRHWYEALHPNSMLETEFERVLESCADMLFPTWHFLRFRELVESDEGRKRPDFALIDVEYRTWWVVEVEMARHDLHSHVLPQVRVLRDGRYSALHVEALLQVKPDLDFERLAALVRNTQPRVWVIVDRSIPQWEPWLAGIDVLLGVIEVYRSDLNQHSIRINGRHPLAPEVAYVECRRSQMVSRLWRVETPAVLAVADGERFAIESEVDGISSVWMRRDTASDVYLHPVVGNPLGEARRARLIKSADGIWIFRIVN